YCRRNHPGARHRRWCRWSISTRRKPNAWRSQKSGKKESRRGRKRSIGGALMATDKMSVQEFGAKIKAKYKEYKDLSDTDIGEKVLAKYPQYRANIRPATPADAAALRAEAAARYKPTGEL